jgi:predicted component of type VI protein secretion system
MNQITLEWQEALQIRTATIHSQQLSKHPGTVRLGRDPAQCDLVLSDPTVSGLHVEIFYGQQNHCFTLRNLRYTNPPVVDGRQIITGEAILTQGSSIQLGQLELKVVDISLAEVNYNIPQTILLPPQPLVAASVSESYGLQCPKCQRISDYDRLDWGCQWCGTSLAAAASNLMTPNNS